MSSQQYMQHVGVLGMHWGKHKSVTESPTIVRARVSVEKAKANIKRANQDMNKQTKYGLLPPSTTSLRNVTRASKEYSYSKQDLISVKILDQLKTQKKSTSQLSLENKYKEKGMNNDEAAVAAYQHLRTKKMLITVAGITLAALATYSAYKIHDSRVDKIIKSGTILQNISDDSTKGIRDAFYSSKNPLDNVKYKGIYGNQLTAFGGKGAFKKQIETLSDIRQVSPNNAKNILSDLVKTDDDFANGIKGYMQTNKSKLGAVYAPKISRAEKSLAKGIVDKNVYEVFNASLVDHSPEMQTLTDKFFNTLSTRGYNAVKDVNDSKYSGYKSINPIIAFNTKGKVDVLDVKELTNKEIDKAKAVGYAAIVGSDLVKQGAIIAASILGLKKTVLTSEKSLTQKQASQYRQKHPTTKLTNTEIIRMFERNRINGS